MIGRIVIDDIRPRTPAGYPAKAVVGEAIQVSADIFRDGHDHLAARVRLRAKDGKGWTDAPLRDAGNDRWEGTIEASELGPHEFVIEAWTDGYATWRNKITTKLGAGQEVEVELEEGARLFESSARRVPKPDRPLLVAAARHLRDTTNTAWERARDALDPAVGELLACPPSPKSLTKSRTHSLWIDRERALVGAWYELFPRSEGGLSGTARRLVDVAAMGFDVLYLSPIHPIGRTARKGKNNSLNALLEDPGSPWAIGSREGGHTAIDAALGTFTDFEVLVEKAEQHGMEIALDYALQCSPDHPWVDEHPEWFHHRPDGSIAHAENPPKKYEDIYPLNFWPEREADRAALWAACEDILRFWIARGVRIFRVDNPHTKPMAFWEWMIPRLRADHPEVVLLSEAFTRPKVMAKLAEVGFSQSYTYFTWRNERWELEEYLNEVSHAETADYMRPAFWTNTPDILSGPLRNGPPAAFRLRLLLASMMVPTYGVYSGYELCENLPASDANEEYLNSEKYEVKTRGWMRSLEEPARTDSLEPLITQLNAIRRRHPALQRLRNARVHPTTNDRVMAWSKISDSGGDVVLVVVNLDPFWIQEATLELDLPALGVGSDERFQVTDELSGSSHDWSGPSPYVRLDPAVAPGHVFVVRAGAP